MTIKNQDKKTIASLLDKHLNQQEQILVQKTQMGTTQAYLASVSLEWLANRVNFASELPLFQHKYNPHTQNIIRDAQTIGEIQQRPLDWSRQGTIVEYLLTRKTHKFPTLLVVIHNDWVDNPHASSWDNHQQAIKSTTEFISLDNNDTIGILDISNNISLFALDGQHRLMGVKGLMTLIKTGSLHLYNKNKKPTGKLITLDDLQIDSAYLHHLSQEKIGVEFIPAVITGETREEAKERIRSIFVHINLSAKQLSKGQLALLNEDNGFAIIARKIAVSHPLLQGIEHTRVNWDNVTIGVNSEYLTTLWSLQDMSEKYLIHTFPHWQPADKGLIPLRPHPTELNQGLQLFTQLFDHLASLPSYQRLADGEEIVTRRRFSYEKKGGIGNILFRPVGQVAVIQALGILVFKLGFSLENIFNKLSPYDSHGGFSNIDKPQSLWYGVLYDGNKQRILVSRRQLATRLIVYLLGGIKDKVDIAYLRRDLAKARSMENHVIDFNGGLIAAKKLCLPEIL